MPQPPERSGTRRAGARSQIGPNTVYLLTAFPRMLVAFVLVVTLLSVGLGMAVIYIGLPIMVVGLYVARGAAASERALLRAVGTDLPAAVYERAEPQSGKLRKLLRPLTDAQSWLDSLWVFIGFIVSTVTWSLALTAWAIPLGFITDLAGFVLRPVLPAWFELGVPWHLTPIPNWLGVAMTGTVAAIDVLALPWILRGLVSLHAGLARGLLAPLSRTRARLQAEQAGRTAAREAEATSLRRLERDIHDGPQQQLVRLKMDLARAERLLASDPDKARQVVAESGARAQDTFDELRALSRGIAPPVLVDRGLAAALTELAARATVPVDLDIALPNHLPAHVETAAYFVASEALTNVAKHSRAESSRLSATVSAGRLRLEVWDDGAGGAAEGKGSGLAGLRQRVHGADGELIVESPSGGPTLIRAEIPCA